MAIKKLILVGILAIGMMGCTSAERGQISALGGSQHVVLYSVTGQIISQWDSNGVVHAEQNSDGWFFVDKNTGKLVRISGTTIITQN